MSEVKADEAEGEPDLEIAMPFPVVPTVSIHCLVCGTSTQGPEGSVFIQPCRCGYWVHDQCLVMLSLQFEDLNPGTSAIGCRICRRAYNISPVKSLFLKYAVKCSTIWYQTFCDFSINLLMELVGDVGLIKLGSYVLKQIYGPEEASRLIASKTPLAAIYACQLIPLVSIFICYIPWETDLLNLLRKGSNLPVFGCIFPMEDEAFEDIYKDHHRYTLDVAGGLLLPMYAVGVSRLLAAWVEEPFRRFLLGGATIVLLKGICKMFYKQKKYVRYCTLSIQNSAATEK